MSEKEEILEIYKIHVEMIDRVSQRRGSMNQFYITVLSALLGVVAFAIDQDLSQYEKTIFIAVGILGLSICILWIAKIHSYKKLNSAKFKVINEIETKMVFSFYEKEWNILTSNNSYTSLTNLEKFSPILLSIPFVILLIFGIIK